MKLTERIRHRSRHNGSALAVSLLLLATMTLLGISVMSGTSLNERVVSNNQQKTISYEAAESAILSVWDVDEFVGVIERIPVSSFDKTEALEPLSSTLELSNAFDQSSDDSRSVTVDVAASVTLQFCGETAVMNRSGMNSDESAVRFAGAMIDINGTSEVSGSSAKSDHIQRGYILMPATGRTGSCPQ